MRERDIYRGWVCGERGREVGERERKRVRE